VKIKPTVVGNTDLFLANVKKTIDRSDQIQGKTSLWRWAFREGSATMASFTPCRTSTSTTFLWPDYLSKEFHLPSYVINDAEVAALAEANVGPSKRPNPLFRHDFDRGRRRPHDRRRAPQQLLRSRPHDDRLPWRGPRVRAHGFRSGLKALGDMNGLEITDAREFFELVKNKNPLALSVYQDWIKPRRRLARDDL
jgi:hypothetical protein